MEKFGPYPPAEEEHDDDTDDSSSESWGQRWEGVFSLPDIMQPKHEDEEEDEESDDSGSGVFGRGRSFLSSLGIAREHKEETDRESDEEVASGEIAPEWPTEEQTAETTPELPLTEATEVPPVLPESPTVDPTETAPDDAALLEAAPDMPTPDRVEVAPAEPSETPTSTEETVPDFTPEAASDIPDEVTSETAPSLPDMEPMRAAEREAADLEARTDRLERTAERTEDVAGAALVGTVIVDQLSRHRDRKIRKEAKGIEKQVQKLQHQTSEHEKVVERLDRVAQTETPKIEQLEQTLAAAKTPNFEQVKPRLEPAERPEPLPKAEVEHEEYKPIQQPESAPPIPEMGDLGAEDIFEQIERRHNQDIVSESAYERRHEVKDDDTIQDASQDLQALSGASNSSSAHPLPSWPDDQQYQSKSQSKVASMIQQLLPSDPQAKQAMINGAITAVVIFAIIVVWVLL